MLNIPESVKTLFKTDGTHKNFRVQFPNGEFPDITNENIVRESLHFTESLCSQSTFRFGLAEASVLEFETVGIGNMYGMTINASIEIDVSSLTAAQIADIQAGSWDGELVDVSESDTGYGYFRLPLGVFRVEKCPRNHGAMTHRKVTAYSVEQVQNPPDGTIPGLPTEMAMFSYYEADIIGVLAAGNGDGLEDVGTATFGRIGNNNPRIPLYNAAGTPYEVDLRVSSTSTARVNYRLQNPTLTSHVDFCQAEDFNAAAYYAQGEAVAAALDDLNLNLTYDKSGKKIYNSNTEALLSVRPWFFSPVLVADLYQPPAQSLIDNVWYLPDEVLKRLSPGELVGVPWPTEIAPMLPATTNETCLFQLGGSDVVQTYVYLKAIDTSLAENTLLLEIRNENTGTSQTAEVPLVYNAAPPSVTLFQGTGSGLKLKISNSGGLPSRNAYWYRFSDETSKLAPLKMYSYINSVDYSKLVNGCYELRGLFFKGDRLGSGEPVALSPSTFTQISPTDYDDVWWDEYDVAPIGSVVVTVKGAGKTNAQNTPNTISIGPGASVYDMSNNEAMEKLTANTISDIRTLLRGSFKTNAANVGFTPIEMTMQGWPWMEAGDALRITAEDGTVVRSYALRVEMDGIQHLMATITAEGGEIVGET